MRQALVGCVLARAACRLVKGDILETEATARWRVGGMSGEIWGATKLATWKAFLGEVAEMGLSTKAEQDDRSMWLEFPRNKREAYRRMVRADGGGWSLWYRFHS